MSKLRFFSVNLLSGQLVECPQGNIYVDVEGFLRREERKTARPANTEAIRKLLEKLPYFSARNPAMAGPAICPRANIKVIKPKTLAVFCGPT